MTTDVVTCRHCGRRVVREDGRWIDPEATGDDSVWRETCGQHDTFTAEHEPLILATLAAMREHYDGQVFAYSPTTGAECSANPGDYFWLPEGVPLEDSEGEPMILVRRRVDYEPVGREDSR